MFKFILCKLNNNSGIADVLVLAALGSIFLIVCCANIALSREISFYDLGTGYAEYVRATQPNVYQDLKDDMESLPELDVEQMVINGQIKDVIRFLVKTSTLKDIIVTGHAYLESLGEFTEIGYTFSPPSSGVDVSKEDLRQYFIDFASSYSWQYAFNWSGVFDWIYNDCMSRGTYPYVSFIRATGFSGDDFIIICCSSDEFLGAPPVFTSTGFTGSGICVVGFRNHQTHGNAWVFNGSYTFDQFTSFTVIGQYHYDDSAVAPAPIDNPYTADGREFGLNPVDYADGVAESAEGTQIIHYDDGRTDTRVGVGISLPVDETADGQAIPDVDEAAEIPIDNAIDKPASDVSAPADTTIPDNSTSVQSRVLAFLQGFWKSFTSGIVNALKKFFLPNENEVKRMIADIREVFEDKFGYTGFDFNSIFGESYEPQDFYISDYSAGGLPQVTAKIVDVSFLKNAVLKFRSLMRAIISLLLLIYNLNQLFNFLGYAGVSLGMWHPIDGDEKPEYIKGFLGRGGKFRGD